MNQFDEFRPLLQIITPDNTDFIVIIDAMWKVYLRLLLLFVFLFLSIKKVLQGIIYKEVFLQWKAPFWIEFTLIIDHWGMLLISLNCLDDTLFIYTSPMT